MMSSLKTLESNISSKETEVLNAVKTRSQTEDENIWTVWKAGVFHNRTQVLSGK
jgi:hypothetical protein